MLSSNVYVKLMSQTDYIYNRLHHFINKLSLCLVNYFFVRGNKSYTVGKFIPP